MPADAGRVSVSSTMLPAAVMRSGVSADGVPVFFPASRAQCWPAYAGATRHMADLEVETPRPGLLSTITSKAKPVELMTTAMHKDWPSPQKFIGHDDQQGEQGGAHHHRLAQGNVKPAKD
ncbi:uncharacterized protein [Triticum aestivum]|uniref:uncharacterized protein n=1 Tax=Triticum aestivum TaxID=4565 RepID=UPI001D00AB84|nr:uncharacterized protein LOC123057810 [Triticum aestivum]